MDRETHSVQVFFIQQGQLKNDWKLLIYLLRANVPDSKNSKELNTIKQGWRLYAHHHRNLTIYFQMRKYITYSIYIGNWFF